MRSRSLIEPSTRPPAPRPPSPGSSGRGRCCRNIRSARVLVNTRPPNARAALGRLPVARVSLDSAKAGGAAAAGDASSISERPFAAAAAAGGQDAYETGPVSSSRTSKACNVPAASRTKKTAGLCSDQATDVTASGQELPALLLLLPAAKNPPSHTVSGAAEPSCGAVECREAVGKVLVQCLQG